MLRQFTPDICGILIDQVAGLTFRTRSRKMNHMFLTVMTFLNSFVIARGFGVFHSDDSFGACDTKSSIGHSTGYGVCNINVSFVLPNGCLTLKTP